MDNCVFCNIVSGKIPCYQVWEDEKYLAFLTISPHQRGHTLLIPKKHTDYLFDLDDSDIAEIVVRAKPIASALKQAFMPKTGKIGLMVAGMGVPHVHLHLIPMDSEKDLSFSSACHNVDEHEFEENLKKAKEFI